MSLLDKALEIAEEYPVFPCDIKKRPVCEGGFKDATQDPDRIAQLFSNPRAALIGMPTGAVSGLSVIDIDVNNGKSGKEWKANNAEKLGATRIAETQSGGWHFYYLHSDGVRNRAGIDNCVDIRGDGGYVIHPSSTGYRWLNSEDFTQFPSWIADFRSSGDALGSLSDSTTDAFGSITDGREKYMARMVLASVASYYREHGTYPTVQWMINSVWPVYQMKVKARAGDLEAEGRGITEFTRKCESTIKKARSGGFDDLHIAPPSAIPKTIAEALPVDDAKPLQRKIILKSLSDLRNTPPPSFQVAPYLIDKSFGVLFGAPASYKSFLALDWALSIAHGSDWNGRLVIQGTVVYLALEGQTGLATRSEAWHRERGLNDAQAPFYAVTSPISMAEDNSEDVIMLADAIKEGLQGELPSLIVVDTLARSFVGKDENSATDMGVFVRNVDMLREHFDCTVLVVHHSGKATERGMRGSSALRGAVDSEFELVREAGTQGVNLKVRKQKDTEEAEDLWLSPREIKWVENGFGAERSSLVLDCLDNAPPKPVQLSDDQKVAMQILERMISAGTLWETNAAGDEGIPDNLWRQAVAEQLPEKADASNWNKFRKRLDGKQIIRFNNGLVTLGGKAAT